MGKYKDFVVSVMDEGGVRSFAYRRVWYKLPEDTFKVLRPFVDSIRVRIHCILHPFILGYRGNGKWMR